MSAYCTQADIEGEIQAPDLISLTDDSYPPAGIVNATVLAQIIENASGVVDRYVGNIYEVPFSPIPAAVKSLTITIVCYRLYRRRLVPDEKNNFAQDYLEALKFLKEVNKGESKLGLETDREFSPVAANTARSPWGSSNSLASSL